MTAAIVLGRLPIARSRQRSRSRTSCIKSTRPPRTAMAPTASKARRQAATRGLGIQRPTDLRLAPGAFLTEVVPLLVRPRPFVDRRFLVGIHLSLAFRELFEDLGGGAALGAVDGLGIGERLLPQSSLGASSSRETTPGLSPSGVVVSSRSSSLSSSASAWTWSRSRARSETSCQRPRDRRPLSGRGPERAP